VSRSPMVLQETVTPGGEFPSSLAFSCEHYADQRPSVT
jgi:hypothetical protein